MCEDCRVGEKFGAKRRLLSVCTYTVETAERGPV